MHTFSIYWDVAPRYNDFLSAVFGQVEKYFHPDWESHRGTLCLGTLPLLQSPKEERTSSGICRNPFKLDIAKSGQPYRKCPSECTRSAINWNAIIWMLEWVSVKEKYWPSHKRGFYYNTSKVTLYTFLYFCVFCDCFGDTYNYILKHVK